METKSVTRRRHSRALKTEVLAACREPGASVAAIAMAHGLNANLVHRWRKNAAGGVALADARPVADGFIALTLPTTAVPSKLPDIRIELRRGPMTVTVNWPMVGAGECTAWLRDWLR
jgi:transposase